MNLILRRGEKEALDQREINKMKDIINKLIIDALHTLKLDEVDFTVEHPTDITLGDYATNVALIFAKQAGKSPVDVAKELVATLEELKPKEIKKIEIAGPGFINFFLDSSFFIGMTQNILNQETGFGRNGSLQNQKISIEYTDPNPFKQFHIGHLMSNSIGEAISRILEWNGAEVTRMCYQGDIGLHVAKAIWGMMQTQSAFPHDDASLGDKVEFLGKAYSFGATQYDEHEDIKKEIQGLNKSIFEQLDIQSNLYYAKGREWSLQHFEDIYEKLGTKFDHYFFESDMISTGLSLVKDNIEKGIFEESSGAVVYHAEKEGLHTRVFINSLGIPTYEAKELGLALAKEKVGEFDKSIVITAVEQKDYFAVVKSALSKLHPEIAKKTEHITHGMMRFEDGKMSSRTGNVITGESLIADVEADVFEKIKDRGFSKEDTEDIKEMVAIGAIKYSILKQSSTKDIIFDKEKSLSLEGDSGPYLQYAYTRAKSVLEKARVEGIAHSEGTEPKDWHTTRLEKLLYRFSEVVERSKDEYAPQYIVTYLMELTSAFNHLYEEQQIINKDDPSSPYKVALTHALITVLRSGAYILGIKLPDSM
jgi:arginyl-tRNA synthetase